jgi:hypothetical protein
MNNLRQLGSIFFILKRNRFAFLLNFLLSPNCEQPFAQNRLRFLVKSAAIMEFQRLSFMKHNFLLLKIFLLCLLGLLTFVKGAFIFFRDALSWFNVQAPLLFKKCLIWGISLFLIQILFKTFVKNRTLCFNSSRVRLVFPTKRLI